MFIRWLLFAAIIFLVRRVVLSLFVKKSGAQDRMSSGRPRRTRTQDRPDPKPKPKEDEIAAGQRIEEADFEELD